MTGTIFNKESFLDTVSGRLGRTGRPLPPVRKWSRKPQDEVLKGATADELVEVLREQCQRIHTTFMTCTLGQLPARLEQQMDAYEGGTTIAWKDDRFAEWGLSDLFFNREVHEWNPLASLKNISLASQANIGITISEITLAESGTAVTFADAFKGRTVSFLPVHSIVLIPKSSLVARMTQATLRMRERFLETGEVPSCVNFITGPSNSADIELNLVVGVHGPVKACYIVVEDL